VFGSPKDAFFADDAQMSFDDFKALATKIGEKRAVTSFDKRERRSKSMVIPATQCPIRTLKRNSIA